MNSKPFVHLHVHTKYSVLDGACHIDQLMDFALEHNMPAVAITDHGVMFGIIDFYKAAKDRGIKPILGCETYVASGDMTDRKTESGKQTANHLVLLAENDTGYRNLSKLVSAAHLEGYYYKPRIDKKLLAAHSAGLIGLSACLKGEIAEELNADNTQAALRAAGEYVDILGKDNFFIELMDHGLSDQRKVNPRLIELASKTGIPTVVTNDVHYLKREHAQAHDVLLCIQTGTLLSDQKRMRYESDQFYMKTRDEMLRSFSEVPDALDRTVQIAERCSVAIEFGKLHFPTYLVPDGFTQKNYLIHLGYQGIAKRYSIPDPAHPRNDFEKFIVDRFHHELNVIEKTGFINYFLVVWDFVRFAKESGIPVGPGRGSGGGSIVAYALDIIAIDPIKYDLVFERFLNPERRSPPDFDIDFCQARRGEVIDYVKRKYGRENVAQIITFGTLGAKTVIRDVGRVLEIPYAKCDALSKLVPADPKITLKKASSESAEFRTAAEGDLEFQRILSYAYVLEGLCRNPSTHAAGVVIGEKPLEQIIPLARDKDGQPVTQYTMEPLGEIGLLKMDFLGLKTLTVIREAVDLVQATTGKQLDIENLPIDNPATYALLNRGETVGIFQLESPGMRDLIRRIGINNIEELIAVIALYRPGPMEMLPDYVDRKTGKAPIQYDHKLLEPILKDTFGVMVYQEQVQKAANVLAGYSLGQADVLRRAMGKKKKEVMAAERENFIKGCHETNKISAALAGRIFDNIASFAGYGFNKAHSAGYGIVSYQTAYLKANHPAEFMSALISSEIGNFDKLPSFVAEAEAMGLKVLPPDVNASDARFKPENRTIRFGLAGIKNVGEAASDAIASERRRNGPFKDLPDMLARIDSQLVNKKVIENLARSGAMDSFRMHRARLFHAIDTAMSRAQESIRDRKSGQGSLFDIMGDHSSNNTNDMPDCEPWPENQLLAAEKELLGMYISGHPLTQHSELLRRYSLTSVSGLPQVQAGSYTRIGGIVSQLTKRVTKTSKEAMAIILLEDLEGSVEVVAYPECFAEYSHAIAQDAPIMVCGQVSNRNNEVNIIAQEIYPLAQAPRLFTSRVSLHIPTREVPNGRLDTIASILKRHPGNTPVVLCLIFPNGEKVFVEAHSSFNVLPDSAFTAAIQQELGEGSIYISAESRPCIKPPPPRRNRDFSEK